MNHRKDKRTPTVLQTPWLTGAQMALNWIQVHSWLPQLTYQQRGTEERASLPHIHHSPSSISLQTENALTICQAEIALGMSQRGKTIKDQPGGNAESCETGEVFVFPSEKGKCFILQKTKSTKQNNIKCLISWLLLKSKITFSNSFFSVRQRLCSRILLLFFALPSLPFHFL